MALREGEMIDRPSVLDLLKASPAIMVGIIREKVGGVLDSIKNKRD